MIPSFPPQPIRIGFVIFPDFQLLDAAGPISAFDIAGRLSPSDGLGGDASAYELHVLAAKAGPVPSSCGVSLAAVAWRDAPALDTIVVAGGGGSRDAAAVAPLVEQLKAEAPSSRRVASVCSGAFLLAEAGLLNGRRATTHWSLTAVFARRFAKVCVEPDRIYTRDGPVWTSAGITAGIDLALALIAEDLGEAIARRTAQQLVVYYRRPGGQSQFSALASLDRGDGRFSGLLGWMRERLAEPLSIDQLAAQAGMSPRNFARAFAAETGVTPARAVERLRLEDAREQVEAGATPIEAIARASGFGDPERMRKAFVRAFGLPPQAMRRAAGQR